MGDRYFRVWGGVLARNGTPEKTQISPRIFMLRTLLRIFSYQKNNSLLGFQVSSEKSVRLQSLEFMYAKSGR